MLFSHMPNPNIQGNAAMGIAIGWFTSQGYIVSIPLTDSQDYDLVVENLAEDTGLLKVQVKSTSHTVGKGAIFSVDLRTNGGNRSGTGKTKHFDECEVDLLFVVCDDGTMYLFEKSDVNNRSTMNLGVKYASFKVVF